MIEPTLEVLEGWGGSCRSRSWVYRPRSVEEAAEALSHAASQGLTVVHRGAGLSYGDAALNQGGAVLEVRGVGRAVKLDPDRGRAFVEAGATIEDLWKTVLPHGWWPPVVPGSMKATVGGCAAMDVHGKNHYQSGSFGEQLEAVRLLQPSGGVREITHDQSGPFSDVVGAQGLTGTITAVTVRLQRVHSGYLEVQSLATPSLEATLDLLEERTPASAHAVAWIDCIAPAGATGRGALHLARDLPPDHPLAGRGLALEDQRLPRRIMGVLPKDRAWRVLRPFARDGGIQTLNSGRYWFGRLKSGKVYHQPHAAFHFLLDYIPGWKRAYGPGGLLQYQMFVADDVARPALHEALALQKKWGVYAYLGVVKRHRAGRFAAPYSMRGYSLAMDIPTRGARAELLQGLCTDLDALLREVGGRVYAAKDAVSIGILPKMRDPMFCSDLVRRWERGAFIAS